MGEITRHAGFPFATGEVLSAGTRSSPDGLELDIARFYAEFNGGVSNDNIAAEASIDGAKFAANSISGAKFANVSITAEKILDQSVTDTQVADDAVTTAKMVAGCASATAAVSANTSGLTFTLTEWITLATQAIVTGISTSSNQRVLIFFRLQHADNNTLNHNSISQFRLRRDSAVIYLSEAAQYIEDEGGGDPVKETCCGMWLDTAAPAEASVTYDLQVNFNSNSGGHLVSSAGLALFNLRR